jgi:hypothetical protein
MDVANTPSPLTIYQEPIPLARDKKNNLSEDPWEKDFLLPGNKRGV